MIRFRKILCPVDFFPASLQAFDYAIKLASHYDADIHALHVVAPVMGVAYVVSLGAQELTAEYEKQSRRLLEKLKTKAVKAGVRIETEVKVGDIDRTIRASAQARRADLVIMGTHGRRPFEHMVLGSVTERIIRHCPIPVMTIGATKKPGAVPPKLRRILVTTDFSDGTADAMNYALSIAQECQSQVTLLHVVHAISADLSGSYRAPLLSGVETELQKLVPHGVRNWCEVDTRVETGQPSRIIPSILKAEKFDLLIMNIHGKGFLDRAVIGSTAERAVRAAAGICPVLLIPPMKKPPARQA